MVSPQRKNRDNEESVSNKRTRRVMNAPNRLGKTAANHELNLSDSFGTVFSDDSFEDRDYVPNEESNDESTENVVARISKTGVSFPKNKKARTQQNCVQNNQQTEQATILNFDDAFDTLSATQSTSNSANSQKENPIHVRGQDDTEIKVLCQTILSEFRHFAKESLARIGTVEEAMLNNGLLSMLNNSNKTKSAEMFEKSRIFGKSNRLPITNETDFLEFEKNLKDDEFRKIAVNKQYFS